MTTLARAVYADPASAVRAWQSGGGAIVSHVDALKESAESSVYRLETHDGTIVAKSAALGLPLEHWVYRSLLPDLGLSAIRSFGLLPDPLAGATWLFLEEAAGQPYREANPEQRALASRWLGRFHARTSRSPSSAIPVLPITYAEDIRTSLHVLAGTLPQAGTEAVAPLVGQLRELLGRAPDVERAMAVGPRSIAHSDFIPKNVRMLTRGQAVIVAVLDWGRAGYGSPAEDLAGLDPDAYALGAEDERWVAAVGGLFAIAPLVRLASWIRVEALELASPWPHRAIAKLGWYATRLEQIGVAGR